MSDFNREVPPAVPTRDSTFPNTIDDLGDTERPTQTRRKWRIEVCSYCVLSDTLHVYCLLTIKSLLTLGG